MAAEALEVIMDDEEETEKPIDLGPGTYRLKIAKVLLAAWRQLRDGSIIFRVEEKPPKD